MRFGLDGTAVVQPDDPEPRGRGRLVGGGSGVVVGGAMSGGADVFAFGGVGLVGVGGSMKILFGGLLVSGTGSEVSGGWPAGPRLMIGTSDCVGSLFILVGSGTGGSF